MTKQTEEELIEKYRKEWKVTAKNVWWEKAFRELFRAGKLQAVEDEIKFLESWLSLFWENPDCECCEAHKEKLKDRLSKLQNKERNGN